MKNKVLAALLSVCLFAGLAVPAFAAVDVTNSSLAATAEEGKVIKTTETAVEIKNGDDKELLDVVSLLVDDTLAADPSELVWDLEDEEGAFVNNGSVYSAIADKGTGYALISTPDGKAELKIKLTAKAADKAPRDATGFKFEKTSYSLVGKLGSDAAAIDNEIKIVPSNTNAKFTGAQETALDKIDDILVAAEGLVGGGTTLTGTAGSMNPEKTVYTIKILQAASATIDIAANTWIGGTKTAAGISIEYSAATTSLVAHNNKMTVTLAGFSGGNPRSASTTLKFVAPIAAADIRNGGTLNIAVGEEFDLDDHIRIIPTTANNLTDAQKAITYSYDLYNDNYDDSEFVAVDGTKNIIRGVKQGKLKVTASNAHLNKSTTFVVNVTPFKGAAAKGDEDVPLVAPQRTLKVGQTFTVTLGGDLPADTEATYGSLREDIATVSDTGVVTAVKAGEAKVWVQVDGYAKGYYTVTVTDGSSTNVPQTAVVALAPLF